MSESSNAASKGISGWFKAAVAAVFSAVSGAALMYASPLLDTIIKPAKPVANFQAQPSGLKVTFQNKSTGGLEGWWDFGDGSALEPFVPEEPAIVHAYAKAGSYSVKLSLKNLIHEENERVATVALDQATSEPAGPSIDTFEVAAVRGDYAPATFRIATTVKNADMCVWALGDRPIEFSSEIGNGNLQKYVTFKEPGNHVVRLAAFNGKKPVEKTVVVAVKQAPAGMMTATLALTYEAVLVEQKATNRFVQMHFPVQQKGDVVAVPQAISADAGYEFVKADVVQPFKNPSVKSAIVQVDQARHDRAVLTCELIRPTGKTPTAPACVVQLALVEQRQSAPVVKPLDPISVGLTVPGTTMMPMPPLPPGWVAKSRKMTLSLQQSGQQSNWTDASMPHNVAVQMPGGAYLVNVTEQSGQLRIDVTPKGVGNIIGN